MLRAEESRTATLRQRDRLRYTLQTFLCLSHTLRLFSGANDEMLSILEEELGQSNSFGRSDHSMLLLLLFGADLAGEHLDLVHTDERVTKIVFSSTMESYSCS